MQIIGEQSQYFFSFFSSPCYIFCSLVKSPEVNLGVRKLEITISLVKVTSRICSGIGIAFGFRSRGISTSKDSPEHSALDALSIQGPHLCRTTDQCKH